MEQRGAGRVGWLDAPFFCPKPGRAIFAPRFPPLARGFFLASRLSCRLTLERGKDHRITALERAFQLARSGQVSGLSDVIEALRREGHSANQIEGPALRRQLTGLIEAARSRPTSFGRSADRTGGPSTDGRQR
jgi:hypothetical protein